MNARQAEKFLVALSGMGIDAYVVDQKEAVTLDELRSEVRKCKACGLSSMRRHVVFGEGNPRAALMFVGEAPGEEEDIQGRPFVGKAGKLLNQLIARTGLRREDVYICNVLKCRPPHNRDPEPVEVSACSSYLFRQIELINPRLICTLGRHAYNTLMGTDEKITRVRGKLTTFRGRPLLPTYHPSFLLRNQERITESHSDMDRVKQLLKRE